MSSSSDDSSDEEYKPQEVESDVPSDAETDYDSDGNKIDKTKTESKTKKRRKTQIGSMEKRPNLKEASAKQSEKDELEEEDEEEKRKSDALWASFLNDTNLSSNCKTEEENQKQETSISDPSKDTKETSIKDPSLTKDTIVEKKTAEKFVTKVFDFAGEEVKVTEKVKDNDMEPQNSTSSKGRAPVKPKFGFGAQRSSGGIGSVLSQLGKKGKISTLEKTKLDWMSYKKDEGIEEELQTHNKGKDG